MQRVAEVSRIAVLRANALGDYILALPALESIKAAYRDAEIVLLGAPWHAQSFTGRPGPVDRVLIAPALRGIRDPVPDDPVPADRLGEFVDRARAERFDLALQLHGGGRNSNPLIAGIGARLTAGLRTADAPPLDRTIPYRNYQPEIFRYLEVAELVGAPAVTYRPHFAIDAADRDEAARVLGPASAPRAVLHPGATDPRRRWPAERFGQIGRFLAERGLEVVVTGTPAERELVAEVCERAGAGVRPLAGRLSIGGLAALLAGSTVAVSNDTGPLHLAAAVGTAVVGLFWVGNMINCAWMDRARYCPIISWTTRCPRCGVDSTVALYPHRDGPAPCSHRDSYLVDIPVAEVAAELAQMLDIVAVSAAAGGAGATGSSTNDYLLSDPLTGQNGHGAAASAVSGLDRSGGTG